METVILIRFIWVYKALTDQSNYIEQITPLTLIIQPLIIATIHIIKITKQTTIFTV